MTPNQQTLRVTGLPAAATEDDVNHFFQVHIRQPGMHIQAIGPICKEPGKTTNQTTVTFASRDLARQALQLDYRTRRLTAARGGYEIINLDSDFKDMTTLQSFANPKTGMPDIDIVCLHGLNGHAWNTFTAQEASYQDSDLVRENNWLQANLPRLLQQHEEKNIHARVMTFGYDADVWMSKSVAEIEEPVRNLLWSMRVERQNCPDRPLFFIAHSLGGIVVKQAIVKMANEAIIDQLDPNSVSQGKYVFPVQGCLFFGVPHKGAKMASYASGLLTGLNKVFNVHKSHVHDLQPKSERLACISSEFEATQAQLNFPVLSFYENRALSHTIGIVVDKDSAIFDYPDKPEPFGIDKDHREMVKFLTDNDQALRPAVLFLTELAKRAINLQEIRNRISPFRLSPQSGDTAGALQEDRLSVLRNYDTVFLIDDSPSMAGQKWELVKTILDSCTPIATRYDTNGIDIHFFNNTQLDQENVRKPEVAVQIHHDVTLCGSTPLLDRLSVHLKMYFQKYRRAGFAADHKRYNLIILTDGEPDEEYDEDEDPNDPTKPAFKLIRKKIVDYARRLDNDDVDAEPNQVGIQFCQIGKDKDAKVFFEFLDDRLKGKEKLSRDMVDTISCESELDLTDDFFRKLLLGAIDRKEDNRKIEEQHAPQSPLQQDTNITTNDTPAPYVSAQYNTTATLPVRSASGRTNISRTFSESDTVVPPSRGFSFPVDSSLEPLQEVPSRDDVAAGGRPVSMLSSRQGTLRTGQAAEDRSTTASLPQQQVGRSGTWASLRSMGRR